MLYERERDGSEVEVRTQKGFGNEKYSGLDARLDTHYPITPIEGDDDDGV